MMYKQQQQQQQYSAPPYYEIRTPPKHSYPQTTQYYPQKYVPVYPTATREQSRHTRHASYDPAAFYPSPPLPAYMTPQQRDHTYPSPARVSIPTAFAAQTERIRTKAARNNTDTRPSTKKSATKKDRATVLPYDDDYGPDYYGYQSPEGTPPPPYDRRFDYPTDYEDPYIYPTTKTSPPAYKTRTRAASTPQKPTRQPSTKKTKQQPASRSIPKATAKDAARAGIPEGYSLKNWDPNEEPIILLGSVFDANTLGKWIYDWTVFHHGAGAPMADHAGELWLSLIELASKMKRSEECLPRIKYRDNRNCVEDFLDDGQDLLNRLDRILRRCEDFMYKAASRENPGRKISSLGSNSGCAFVDSIFGRDRELESTEQLMADIRYWTHRFNTLCEPILRHPRE